MKLLYSFFCTLVFSSSFGQAVEKIIVPPGVVYHYCDPKTVEKVKSMIINNISDSSDYSLAGRFLVVGPVLWNRFKNIEPLGKIKNGNTTFHVDDKTLTGKMTQDIADSKKIWITLRREIGTESYIIRKLHERELQYYWSVISFDIDEPLLIVETAAHKYILNMSKDTLQLMWLDEVPPKPAM